MKKCGECEHFFTSAANAARDEGYCNAFLDEDGIGKEVTLYQSAEKCPEYKKMGRIRSNVHEFSGDDLCTRVAMGFDEE